MWSPQSRKRRGVPLAGGASGVTADAVSCAVPLVQSGSRRSKRRGPEREIAVDGDTVKYKGTEEEADGFLRRRRVGPKGREKYLKASTRFREFCAQRSLPLTTTSEVDSALDRNLVHLFASCKAPLQEGREAYYGNRFAFDLQNFHLPLSRMPPCPASSVKIPIWLESLAPGKQRALRHPRFWKCQSPKLHLLRRPS